VNKTHSAAAPLLLAALLPGILLSAAVAPNAFAQGGPPVPRRRTAATPPTTPSPAAPRTAPAGGAAGAAATTVDDAKQLIADAPGALQYPNAAKVTLLDLSDITVRPDGSTRTVTRQAVKILNKRGRDEEAEVKIPYNGTYEKVTILRARTIKPDGTVVNADLSQVRDQTINEGEAMYTDARLKNFSMPAVDDGCIIDYEYVTDEKEPMIPGHFWTNWYFQGGFDPVKLSRLTITAPKGMKLNTQLRNSAIKPTIKEQPDGKTVRYVWEDKDVEPLQLEPMMPEADRILPMLQVSTLPSWQTIAAWFDGLSKTQQKVTPEIKALVAEITAGKTTPEEKARAIFYYVEDKTRYVSISFGKSAFQPHASAEVCANQYGDCKDMTNLLITMLREGGIKAYPALLTAGSKANKSELLPNLRTFDHVICLAEINGKQYWLDATAQIIPWGDIPSADRGAQTLVVRDGGKGEWVTVPDGKPEDNRTTQTVKLALKPDGSATGTVTITGTGDTDLSMRAALSYLPPDKLRPYLESIAQNIGPNARVTNVSQLEYKDKDKPVSVTMEVTFPSWANESGDVLIFKARPEQSKGAASSPFREDGRRLPVTQPSAALAVSFLEVTLPSGYSVLSLPKPTDVKSDLGRFSRSVKVDGNKLTVEMRGENYRADVPAFRYDEVRKYYDTYLRAFDQSVIVKKN
jgi:hypothetical protein